MANKQFEKKNRGDAFITLTGTVGTVPESNTIKTGNGDLDVCNFRLVNTPYRAGQKEPTDIWFTIRVAGNTKYAAGLQKGDFVMVRGGFYVREYEVDGKPRFELVVNADSSPNAIARMSSAKPRTDAEPVAAGVSAEVPADGSAVGGLFD